MRCRRPRRRARGARRAARPRPADPTHAIPTPISARQSVSPSSTASSFEGGTATSTTVVPATASEPRTPSSSRTSTLPAARLIAAVCSSISSGHPSRATSTRSGVATTAEGSGTASSIFLPASSPPSDVHHHTSRLRERPDLDGDLDDRPERPEGARREPVDVVARDALDRSRAAPHEPPVARDELASPRRCRASGPIRSRRGEEEAVAIVPPTVASSEASAGHSCPPSARTRPEVADPHPRFDDGQHLRGVVRDHAIETRRRELACRPRTGCPCLRGSCRRRSRPASRLRLPRRVPRGPLLRSRLDQIHVPSGMASSGVAGPRRIRPGSGHGEVPAARAVGQHLLRVHPAGRIERAPHARLGGEVVLREHERHEVALLQPDPVLAAERAAGVDAEPDDLLRRSEHALQHARLASVEGQQRMQVAVARVEHVGDGDALAPADRVDAGQDLDQLRARHHAVVEVVVRRDLGDRAERRLPALPEQGALFRRRRHPDRADPVRPPRPPRPHEPPRRRLPRSRPPRPAAPRPRRSGSPRARRLRPRGRSPDPSSRAPPARRPRR